MKKDPFQTARVHWHMGQALMPEHFYAQEDSLREEIVLRQRMGAMPGFGIGSLQWNTKLLEKGVVSLQELTLIMESGELIDIPGNTQPIVMKVPEGKSQVDLYLHLAGSEVIQQGEGDLGEESIERKVRTVELKTDLTSDGVGPPPFLIGKLNKVGTTDVWELDHSFIPAMVRVRPAPFFDHVLTRVQLLVRRFHEAMVEASDRDHLAGESQKAATKQGLRSVFRLNSWLKHIESGVISPHPYEVFEAVYGFFIDVCLYYDTSPESDPNDPAWEDYRGYEHRRLGPSFDPLLVKLSNLIKSRPSALPYTAFERAEGLYVCELGPAARKARNIFWLVRKKNVTDVVDLSTVKLASPDRLETVAKRALRGIPHEPIDRPPFHHSYSSEVEFHGLQLGEEWDNAVKEGKLAFYASPEFEDARFFAYWRNE